MERAIELANNCQRVKNNNVYETLSSEFNISKRSAGDRFKSVMGMNVRDYISKNITPSKEVIIDCLVKSENFNEFYKLTNFNNVAELTKLMKKHFGQSNYFKLKLFFTAKIPNNKYVVTLKDNESILISQYFGDGHIERGNSLKIEHCEKQYDYLKFKISLLNKAYPNTNGLEKIYKRNNNGYISYSYRTNSCLKKQIDKLLSKSDGEKIKTITPFGVCLFFLDDGYYCFNEKYNTSELGFSIKSNEIKYYFSQYFKTYGYNFNIDDKAITLKSKIEIVKFINEFIKPFDYLLPECVKYKYDYKDIVGGVY